MIVLSRTDTRISATSKAMSERLCRCLKRAKFNRGWFDWRRRQNPGASPPRLGSADRRASNCRSRAGRVPRQTRSEKVRFLVMYDRGAVGTGDGRNRCLLYTDRCLEKLSDLELTHSSLDWEHMMKNTTTVMSVSWIDRTNPGPTLLLRNHGHLAGKPPHGLHELRTA